MVLDEPQRIELRSDDLHHGLVYRFIDGCVKGCLGTNSSTEAGYAITVSLLSDLFHQRVAILFFYTCRSVKQLTICWLRLFSPRELRCSEIAHHSFFRLLRDEL